MKPEDLGIVINKWNEEDPESQFILAYYNVNDGINISYARSSYINLLEPYDLFDVDYEDWTMEQVIDHEIPENKSGYIYKKDENGNIKLLAKIER